MPNTMPESQNPGLDSPGHHHPDKAIPEVIEPSRLEGRDKSAPGFEGDARAVIDATVSAVDPEQVILFGSRARGDAHAESDIDLLVIMQEPFTAEHSRQDHLRRIRRALRDCRLPVDILLYSRDEVDAWRDSPNHVVGRSLREGVAVYARY